MRRYSAAIAIVKEAIKKNLTIHEAYAFALTSEPLLDKQEEENGYSIQKDVAKIWRRETGIKPSGTLTADDILSAHQTDDARNKTSTLSRSEEHTSELQSLMRISYAVFCLKNNNTIRKKQQQTPTHTQITKNTHIT